VTWPGADLERCGIGERSWAPMGVACWYPVDLLRPEGTFEVWRRRADDRETRAVSVSAYPYPEQRIDLEDDTRVRLSDAALERSRRESARIAELWPSERPRRFELPLSPPLEKMPSGGRFGSRRIFNGEPRSPHTGSDYSAPAGAAVLAVAAGRVRLAEEHFFAGNSVFIDHGDGLISMYFHLRDILVAVGDEVGRGEKIGRVGATGRASGAHLHFGLRWHGARIDPELLLGPPEAIPDLP
jgi:murein DD-endopeptidase MepM/ murein hydrolase activator NlpD